MSSEPETIPLGFVAMKAIAIWAFVIFAGVMVYRTHQDNQRVLHDMCTSMWVEPCNKYFPNEVPHAQRW